MKKILFALAATAIITYPALAGDVNFGITIVDQDDKPMADCTKVDKVDPTKCAEGATREVTLRIIAIAALNVADPAIPADEQVRRGLLAQNIYKSIGPMALDAKDTEILKAAIAKRGYTPLIVLQAFQQLDPASVKK